MEFGTIRYELEDDGAIARIGPARALHGTSGHLWEQTVLPLLVKQRPYLLVVESDL